MVPNLVVVVHECVELLLSIQEPTVVVRDFGLLRLASLLNIANGLRMLESRRT